MQSFNLPCHLFDVAKVGGRGVAAGPVVQIDAAFDVAVEAAVRPVTRAGDVTGLNRIVMDVVEMPFKIVFVFERVFPESGLPDAAAAFLRPPGADRPLGPAAGEPVLRELLLDPPPAVEYPSSPGGRLQSACRCSGRSTIALMVNGERN